MKALGFEIDNKTIMYGTGAAIVLFLFMKWQAKEAIASTVSAIEKAAPAVNPVSEENIFFKGFTSLYQGLTGSNQTLGADIYDWTHKKESEILTSPTSPDTAKSYQDALYGLPII